MTTARRLLAASAALSLAALLGACATPATSGGTPNEATSPPPAADTEGEPRAAWLDDGRGIAIVTWGSSGCVPIAGDASADGQSVTVELLDREADEVCTADYAPRASFVGLPDGVDPTQDVSIDLTYGDTTATIELAGAADLAGVPGESTEFAPSAGWFDTGGFVILTWGSSSCVPVVQSAEATSPEQVTVTFAERPADEVCTMDMAPRANVAEVEGVDADAVTLTLVGGGLDGTLPILGLR